MVGECDGSQSRRYLMARCCRLSTSEITDRDGGVEVAVVSEKETATEVDARFLVSKIASTEVK